MEVNRPLTYDNFMAMRDVKVAERQSHFSKKGGRPKRKQAVSVSTSTVSPVHCALVFVNEVEFLKSDNISMLNCTRAMSK